MLEYKISMYKRNAEKTLKNLADSYPVVAVTGPRQSGKTTLVRSLFKDKTYISLEDLDQQAFAKEDPKSFLTQTNKALVIDEIQNCPSLFSYIQGIVDRSRKAGQFIVTGSSQFGLLSGISQSLAGRVGLLELLPFSLAEVRKIIKTKEQVLYQGLYPPLYDKKIQPSLWYEDYVKTYLERDLRQLINIKDLSKFQKFLSLCAVRSAQLLNYSELSNTAGINMRTVKEWLSVLEASYIIFLLKPYYRNFSKRLVKAPKLYFYDTGLLCYLLRLKEEDLPLSPYKGALFESLIISECMKYNKNYRKGLDFHFWKSSKGVEVDLLFEAKQKICSVEIKSGQTIQSHFFKNLKQFKEYSGPLHGQSFLIYGGEKKQKRSHSQVLPWKNSFQML